MSMTARRILKADEVTLEGVYRLRIDPGVSPHDASAGRPAEPKVRVAEVHPDHAVIEITCPCGRTSHIRCDYAETDPASAPPESVPS